MKFHELVKKKRKEKGLTLKQLAKKVGSTQASMSNFQNGKVGINSNLLEKIFNELDIKIKEENN